METSNAAAGTRQFGRERRALRYRNLHFSTVIKREGALYALVTDAGYRDETTIVWERLDAVDGDTDLCGADFRKAAAKAEPAPQDPDHLLALQLQREAEAEGARAAPAPNDTDASLQAALAASRGDAAPQRVTSSQDADLQAALALSVWLRGVYTVASRRVSVDDPRRSRDVTTRLRGLSAAEPRWRRVSADYPRQSHGVAASLRTIRVNAAAVPRLRGRSASKPRRRRVSKDRVGAAATRPRTFRTAGREDAATAAPDTAAPTPASAPAKTDTDADHLAALQLAYGSEPPVAAAVPLTDRDEDLARQLQAEEDASARAARAPAEEVYVRFVVISLLRVSAGFCVLLRLYASPKLRPVSPCDTRTRLAQASR